MKVTLAAMMILLGMALHTANSQTAGTSTNPATSPPPAATSSPSNAPFAPSATASNPVIPTPPSASAPPPNPAPLQPRSGMSLENVITISGWCVTIITGFGSIIVSAWFYHLSTKQVLAAQTTQTETSNHIRDFLTRIVTELQFLKEAGTRTEGMVQSVQVEMARKLAMHGVETMEERLKETLAELSTKLGGVGNAKQVLDETTKAVEAAAQTSRNTVLAFQSALQVLATLDRQYMTVALAALKLSISGQKPSVALIASMSAFEEHIVAKAVERLTKEGVTMSDCSLNEPFRNALSYLLSAVEEYPGMRFQERVNAILECLQRATRPR